MAQDKHSNSARHTLTSVLKLAPWTLSLAVHIVVACVLTFIYMLTVSPAGEEIIVPDMKLSASGPVKPAKPTKKPQESPESITKKPAPLDLSKIVAPPPEDSSSNQTIDFSASESTDIDLWDSDDFDKSTSADTRFFDAAGNAMNIVYVADWSGSLISGGTYDTVLAELRRSISDLSPQQYFHIILFSSGEPSEPPPKRLVPATDRAKLNAWQFIRSEQSSSRTEPVSALKRAFSVLARTSKKREGKLIYLLTDGFLDINELRMALKKLNKSHDISVNIILHQDQRPAVRQSLADIAAENSGMFAYIEPS